MNTDGRKRKPGVPPTAPRLLNVAELAEYLRVHPTTIYRLLRTWQLPGFHVGSEWRFSADVIEQWRKEGEQIVKPAKRRRKGLPRHKGRRTNTVALKRK